MLHRLRSGDDQGQALADTVLEVAEAAPGSRLNLLLTDGETITATAWGDTLWYLAEPGRRTVVASEPYDDDPHWREVPDRTLLAASRTDVLLTPLKEPTRVSPFQLTRTLPEDATGAALRADVLHGLTGTPKTLPPKWFYDARGSELFEEITELPEYYPTRAEREILLARARRDRRGHAAPAPWSSWVPARRRRPAICSTRCRTCTPTSRWTSARAR